MKISIIIGVVVIAIVLAIGVYYYSSVGEPEPESNVASCAVEGEQFSSVFTDEYPGVCCEGLTGWDSGTDTSISVGDNCYETMGLSGNPVGTCISCGNGICENIEDVCNCPDDCKNGENSDYASAEDFCNEYVGKSTGLTTTCEEFSEDASICDLCEWA